MRKIINFNDLWYFTRADGREAAAEPVTLPHTWNAQDGTDGGNDYWRGSAYYYKHFTHPVLKDGERLFLECKGAAMIADVTLNGVKIAHHEGG